MKYRNIPLVLSSVKVVIANRKDEKSLGAW